mmetsp:Transcript_95687/g.209248  ORF Transcript_95687/g.209248 Transcript_95687/m.209248 type:complete len:89 (+) Transcript_95687:88-354(+)
MGSLRFYLPHRRPSSACLSSKAMVVPHRKDSFGLGLCWGNEEYSASCFLSFDFHWRTHRFSNSSLNPADCVIATQKEGTAIFVGLFVP